MLIDGAQRMVRMTPRQPVLRPRVVQETWAVTIFQGGDFVEGEVIGGDAIDLIQITCEKGEFGTAMREAGYDITDMNLQYMRQLIS